MIRRTFSSLVALSSGLALAVACAGSPAQPPAAPPPAPPLAPLPAALVATATASPADSPPPPGIAPDWHFPKIADQTAQNGLLVRVVERHALPVVQLELVIDSGSAADGDKPGLAAVAGELLKAGGAGKWTSRALLDAAESLGSSLDVLTDRDSTRITMSVTKDHLAEALDILAAVAVKPRFDAAEFQKLKRREIDRVSSLTRTNAGWAASMVLYRELFQLPAGVHPYSRFDSTPKQLESLTLADCNTWHKRQVTPKNSFLVIAGDVDQKGAGQEVERAFGTWSGERPESPSITAPVPPGALSIFLVDRPSSPQAEVYVATLGPERQSPDWPAMRTTNQILGGGVAGRLFLDVREKRSLAYRTRSSIDAVAHGPSPIILSAGTQTAKAGLTLDALLQHYEGMVKNPPTEDETGIATRYLSDVFLVGVDTVGAIANMTTDLSVFGLPPDYYDTYRAAVRNITKDGVTAIATRYLQSGKAVVVVAGDATRLGKPLSHFGAVKVVDPEAGFVTKTTLAYDPTAPIELERINGT
ncbi:MAG TPA: pitrilysin family protein [Polyangiaceae bacterium]|jgi:predicted Zn-dependent peptidase|nr:pitrilysin family protein [Polyangiaceae bacterium]